MLPNVHMFICLCNFCLCHTFVIVNSIACTWTLFMCVIVCARIGPTHPLLRLVAGLVWLPVCIPAPAVTPWWFRGPEVADRLAARKVKITIFLLKTAYVVALQVHLSVPAPWLSAYSFAPNASAGSPPPVAPVLWYIRSCWLQRMPVYCLQISCNDWLRWGGGSDYTDNYKTWECWKQFMPKATGDVPDALPLQ